MTAPDTDSLQPASAPATTAVSVVVTSAADLTDAEALRRRLAAVGARAGLDFDAQVVDGRSGARAALLAAMRGARHEVVVLLDAGRGHPPEVIPELLAALAAGNDLAIGSRYVAGGGDEGDHGPLRWLGRRLTRVLARPLSPVKDPTSGFLALRRSTLENAHAIDADSRALGLELLVKGYARSVVEVPIRVGQPAGGRAPLGVVTHVRRLYMHRFGVWSDFAHFVVVGASGTVVNLACLTALIAAGVGKEAAIGLAIAVSMFTNFLLNRRFTFAGARQQPFFRQLAGFTAACSLGAVVNFMVAAGAHSSLLSDAPIQVSALIGIVAGTALNFVVNRHLVFRVKRPDDSPA